MSPTVISTIAELRTELDDHRRDGRSIGFVPTMGALHAGHASLMTRARAADEIVLASIFVNPLQFAATEDLADYPRDLNSDSELAGECGVDLLFVPTVAEMYPAGTLLTEVRLPRLATKLEGLTRPTHFTGVATVVAKLLNIVGPCRAYFGEKDFQQLAIIRRMVDDLSVPVEVVGCTIVREDDGLAMSSRNVYLTPPEREAASVLRLALDAGEAIVKGGASNPEAVIAAMSAVINGEPLAQLDYATVIDPLTFEIPANLNHDVRLLVAARVGRPRLIDNCGISFEKVL
ncbi:MAG: pantoate--beta-alanine ligase [Acidimicrobiales bacterium]|nr:pantoate--beta-alanine ligase [Acidimicrobiales bacterium]